MCNSKMKHDMSEYLKNRQMCLGVMQKFLTTKEKINIKY